MNRLKNINVNIDESLEEAVIKKLNIKKENINSINVLKKSLDARRKNNIHYVYDVLLDLNKNIKHEDLIEYKEEKIDFLITGSKLLNNRPIVVGSGPAGLFAAYMLSIFGFKPIVIERGEKVEDRIKSVNEFWKNGKLNPNSNVQFGEGGAGTFSDGKLNTLVKDKDHFQKKVFEIFVENGAPKEIMQVNNPHIGTDKLTSIVKNMRNKIIDNGGEFRFNTCLTNIFYNDNSITEVEVNNKERIKTDMLILAIGHSARDTFYMLNKNKINMESKNFAVGIRVEHKRKFINESQYGALADTLDAASYKLTYKGKEKGVYSFCMCPGGFVVNASSNKNLLAINGMSNYNRNSDNSNSAIVVNVNKEDFGNELFDGLKFQEKLEKKAYELSNGKVPVQNIEDFINNKETEELVISPSIKGEYKIANLNLLFPKNILNSLKEGLNDFDKKINGFKKGIAEGVETRTSSPIRILRDENYMTNVKGIYPIGEGSGYAGGITTSAMDGIRIVKKIISEYKGVKNE